MVDAGVHRSWPALTALARQDDHDSQSTHGHDDQEVPHPMPAAYADRRGAAAGSRTGRTSCVLEDQSEPSAPCSRFQIGTVSFKVSMQKRAASNASSRWGADATTTTEGSDRATSPTRCRRARRTTSGQRRRASPATSASRRCASASYASYVSRLTPARSSEWSRTTPVKHTTAPHEGVVAHAVASSMGSGSGESSTQSSPAGGTALIVVNTGLARPMTDTGPKQFVTTPSVQYERARRRRRGRRREPAAARPAGPAVAPSQRDAVVRGGTAANARTDGGEERAHRPRRRGDA